MRKIWLKGILFFLLVSFLIMDFFPQFTNPSFRYNNSSAAHLVWNFGIPYPLFIFDAQNIPYFFVGPIAYIILPMQLFLVLAIVAIRYFFKKFR